MEHKCCTVLYSTVNWSVKWGSRNLDFSFCQGKTALVLNRQAHGFDRSAEDQSVARLLDMWITGLLPTRATTPNVAQQWGPSPPRGGVALMAVVHSPFVSRSSQHFIPVRGFDVRHPLVITVLRRSAQSAATVFNHDKH